MGRYRSDESDDDYSKKSKKKKKRRGRSRSRSSSDSESSRVSSSKSKRSKKKHRRPSHDRSRTPDRRRTSRRSRSNSLDRYGSRRHRSRSPERRPGRSTRSRTRSPAPRRGRSRSRSPSSRRRRSNSPSRSRRARSRTHSPRRRSYSRDRSRDKGSSTRSSETTRDGSLAKTSSSIRGLSISEQISVSSDMTPAEQAEERMRLALKAAAAADEKLKLRSSEMADGIDTKSGLTSLVDSQSFADSVAAVESGNFVQSSFKSSRSTKIKEEPHEVGVSHDDAIFGSLAMSGFTIKPDVDTKPLQLDPDSIIHPSLYCDPEEKMDRWISRLSQMRKRKLEGEAM